MALDWDIEVNACWSSFDPMRSVGESHLHTSLYSVSELSAKRQDPLNNHFVKKFEQLSLTSTLPRNPSHGARWVRSPHDKSLWCSRSRVEFLHKSPHKGFVPCANTKASNRLRHGICIKVSVLIATVVSVLPEAELFTRLLSRNLIKIFKTRYCKGQELIPR